jgi:hypothetical protein
MSGRPPAKALTAKRRAKWERLSADTEAVENVEKQSELSKFFDRGGPSTIRKRQATRSNFKYFQEVVNNRATPQEWWDLDTFIDDSMQFLDGPANIGDGALQDNVQAAVLWRARFSLYYYAVRYIDDFSTIVRRCHETVSDHIMHVGRANRLSEMRRQRKT